MSITVEVYMCDKSVEIRGTICTYLSNWYGMEGEKPKVGVQHNATTNDKCDTLV